MHSRTLLALSALSTLSLSGSASAQLELSSAGTVDISALNLTFIGGLGFDPTTGRLWIADGCGATCTSGVPGSNDLFEVDPVTGAVLSSFDASAVPGLDRGPETVAVHPTTGNLFVATVYGQDEAGIVTQGGVLVSDFATANQATASAFTPSGELYIFSDGSIGGTGRLHRINQTTGAVETNLPLSGFGGLASSLDIDPLTGNAFLFGNFLGALVEIDLATGVVQSITDVTAFVPVTTGVSFAFDATGRRLYFTESSPGAADTMYVLDRGGLGSTYCTPAVPNSSGVPAELLALGSSTVADDHFGLAVHDLPPGQFGYFLAGRTQGSFTPPGSTGVLCLSGNIGRFNATSLIVSGPIGMIEVDLSSIPVNPSAPVLPGETWNFQCWYRDSGTSNFSDAASVLFQ